MTTTTSTGDGGGLFGWWTSAPPAAKRALFAGSLGWMLDAFDIMLYSMVLSSLMPALGMSATVAGELASLTLVASAFGGLFFGVVADRYGRTRALIWSIVIYSVFTAACGLAQNVLQLAIFRVLLGIGMGGEWASGAALVSETWSAEHRGKALGFMQSAWAIGFAAAAVVNAVVLPLWGWRAVFFVGILPAFFTIWIQSQVEEPAIWRESKRTPSATPGRFTDIFRGTLLRLTIAVTLMNGFTMFAWWGFNLWLPGYLSLPTGQGGVGLSVQMMSVLVFVMQIGMWFGYVTFGFISDAIGRRRTYVIYLLSAAVLILLYTATRNAFVLLALGPVVAFFATGYFSGFGAVTAEIYPTDIRATAQGFTYNIGRVGSAVAPFVVGSLSETHGFAVALSISSGAFLLAAAMWAFIPETRGRQLQ